MYGPPAACLRQAQHLAGDWVQVDLVEAGPRGQAGHGHHVAHQRVQEAGAHGGAHVADGQDEAGGGACGRTGMGEGCAACWVKVAGGLLESRGPLPRLISAKWQHLPSSRSPSAVQQVLPPHFASPLWRHVA